MTNNSNWVEKNNKQVKTFHFSNYKAVMAFVNEVMQIAEEQNHHPSLLVEYALVTVSITDHDLGRVSDKCIKFMEAVDLIEINKK
jgi:4a-hydroxytetrahydrobiopterin dehydratase